MATSSDRQFLVEPALYFSVIIEDAQDRFSSPWPFTAVEQLERGRDTFVYQEGGRNDRPHVFAGAPKETQIILKWGMVNDLAFSDWISQVELGAGFRKNLMIIQYRRSAIGKNRDGSQLSTEDILRVYRVTGAFPIRWKGPALNGGSGDIAIEEIQLACDRISVESA